MKKKCEKCGSNTFGEIKVIDWKARAEKAEAELAESDRVLAIHKRDFAAHFKAHQEELAKLDKALDQAIKMGGIEKAQGMPTGFLAGDDGVAWREEETPELAEYIKNKESKNV